MPLESRWPAVLSPSVSFCLLLSPPVFSLLRSLFLSVLWSLFFAALSPFVSFVLRCLLESLAVSPFVLAFLTLSPFI